MNESRRAKLRAFDLRVDQFLEPTRNFKPTIWLFTTATALEKRFDALIENQALDTH